MAIKVLHITPHMGGGVGRVLKALTASSTETNRFQHEICCLDYANRSAVEWSHLSGVAVGGEMAGQDSLLATKIDQADVVQIHWWNHPLVYRFLSADGWPPFRAAVWAHVNAHFAPHRIPDGLLDYADRFVLGTPYTQLSEPIMGRPEQWKQQRLRTVFASSGYDHVIDAVSRPHRGFNVGYVGTVDYSKMHPDFLQMYAATKIPDAQFIVCGGSQHEALRQHATQMGVAERFDFRGPVSDVGEVLATLDVFGYPLQPRHYGASEIAIIEAMAMGVVPVVMRNGCESHIVADGRTGLVADDQTQFTQALEFLYRHPDKRKSMADGARNAAAARFDISHTRHGWHAVYGELTTLPKAARKPLSAGKATGSDLFWVGLGDASEAEVMRSALADPDGRACTRLSELDPVFLGATNGSALQYGRFFPEDQQLHRLCQQVQRVAPQRTAA